MSEKIVFENLVSNADYTGIVLPYLKPEYFQANHHKRLFHYIDGYVEKYNSLPSKKIILTLLDKDPKLTEDGAKELIAYVDDMSFDPSDQKENLDWLVDETEKFCQDQAIYNAIVESTDIIAGNNKKMTKDAIPEIMRDAISISFNAELGHDYYKDAEKRYEYYHETTERIPFGLDSLNKITNGGLIGKTLTVLLATTHGGKSALMCQMAADNVRNGKNVLYLTMEMREEEIAKRIDANMFTIALDDILMIDKKSFGQKINLMKKKAPGTLKIKEFPMGAVHIGNFQAHIKELQLKENFTPDIIYVDYLNLCISQRRTSESINSYTLMQYVSQEMRQLSQRLDVPVVTASQFNRGGSDNTNPGMNDISDSFAVNFVADVVLALINTDEFKEANQLLIKQLKNRLADMGNMSQFLIGFDRPKSKFFDLNNPQAGLMDQKVLSTTEQTKVSGLKF